jgi:hypothetical protein
MSFVVLKLYRGGSDKMRNIFLLIHILRFGTNNRNRIDKLQFAVAETITYEVVAICLH